MSSTPEVATLQAKTSDPKARAMQTSHHLKALAVHKRHSEFYMEDGNVVLRAESTLFKVDLALLHKHSTVLRSITPPIYVGKSRLGGFDDDNPFVLHATKAHDFACLLSILFHNDPVGRFCGTFTVEEWISILELATRYDIQGIREVIVECLHSLPIQPIRKIMIWKRYRLPSTLLMSSYIELCQRKEALTLDIAIALGTELFLKLVQAREQLYLGMKSASCSCGCHGRPETMRAREVVQTVFFNLKEKT